MAKDVRAELAEVLGEIDTLAWDFFPEPDAAIEAIATHLLASDWLAEYVATKQAEAAKETIEAVQRVYDLQCPVLASDNYIKGAWAAHCWWQTVLGGTLRNLRARADRIAP